MTAVMIDTSEFVEELEKEGVEHKQARAFVNVVRRSQEAVLAGQVKALEEVSARTTKDLDSKTEKALIALKNEVNERFIKTDAKIDLLEQRMQSRFTLLQWMLTALIAGVAGLLIRAFST